jgi:rSAM/selenodomain-associated transferase 2
MFSIIIPTFNEAGQIEGIISRVKTANSRYKAEIIVVDGGSTDNTLVIANSCGVVVITCERKGRGAQMNMGASMAKYEILYFLHADSITPINFTSAIFDAVTDGAKSGCFRLRFDYDHWFLKTNAWFTRFDFNGVRFGDQSLFVTKQIFQKVGGFREDLLLMEDQEIIRRLKKFGQFKVIADYVTTSARKYRDNGIYRTQGIFFKIWSLYYLGYSQHKLLQVHQKLVKNQKL